MATKRREIEPATVTQADFVRDASNVMRRAEKEPVVITNAAGVPSFVISVPSDELSVDD